MLEQTNNPLLIDNRHEIIRIIHSLLIALPAHKRRLLPWLQAPALLRITGFIFDPTRLYSAHVYFYFTRVYSMQRVHYKQRFKRVTCKHMTGVTIVHMWYHA